MKSLLRGRSGEHAKRRFSIIQEAYAPGMNAMAAPIQRSGEPATGAVVIAGPSVRLTLKRMQGFGRALRAAADELAIMGNASPLLKSANVGTWGNVLAKPVSRARSAI